MRRWVIAGAVLAAIAVAFVLVWFQPQKLVQDTTVDEPAPTVTATVQTRSGDWKPLAHSVSGTASLIDDDGSTVLRFEDFEVENGPDLVVYLSAGDPSGPGRALGDDVVDLGPLKGNVGDQNYTVPAGTDLEKYDTAVVWCRRFTVAFAAAELA